MSRETLKELVQSVEGQVNFAELLASKTNQPQLKQGHVWKWMNTTKDGIPSEYVIAACEIVNFKFTPHQLRPDIYRHPHDGLPSHMREVA